MSIGFLERCFVVTLFLHVSVHGADKLTVIDAGNYEDFLEVATPLTKPAYSSHEHRISMGAKNPLCDDGAHNLEVDFDGNPVEYTCQSFEGSIDENTTMPLMPVKCLTLPETYSPMHHCMNERVDYYQRLPTFQGHRPAWGVFGEYVYIPPQRYLHNIEHGAVVFLYHPCSNPDVVKKFKETLRGCIRKHIITASRRVTPEHPFVLLTWTCSLELSSFDQSVVVEFVRRFGLHGPEGSFEKEGQYSKMLVEKAVPPNGSDIFDSVLCPGF